MYIGKADGSAFTPGALPVSLALHTAAGTGPRADLPCLPDAWILSRLAVAVEDVHKHLSEYAIALAAETCASASHVPAWSLGWKSRALENLDF